MKKALLLTGVLLALCASYAVAAGPPGLNLAWIVPAPGFGADDCPGTPGMAADAVDACSATASTNHYMGASLVAPPGIVHATGEDVFIDLQVAAPVLDQYWHLEAGGCRAGKLAAVSNSFATWDQLSCIDYWDPNANSGGFNWTSGYGGPNRARLEAVFAVPPTAANAMATGSEYYLINCLFKGGYGGLSQCTDCHDPGCFVLNQCTISQPAGVGDVVVTNQSIRQFVTWQGGANTNCPTSTPTHKSTWGEVKSLYR
jgi:hypothetical protein